MLDYGRAVGVRAVLLCGDVFDSDRPFKKDKEFFYNAVKSHADTDFYYLRGNHDTSASYIEELPNLKTFTPDGPKLCNLNGSAYAAQVFNNIPANDGRVIKIAWGRISFEGMPFNGCMLLPQEQMLFNTRSGLRLASRPVREVEQLFTKVYSGEDLSMRQANDVMRQFDGDDVLRIRMTMHLSHATDAGLSYRGQRIVNYDMNGNRLNGEFYATDDPGSMMLTADVYMDRSMAEVFVDGGMYSYSMGLEVRSTIKDGYVLWGNNINIIKNGSKLVNLKHKIN